MMRSHHSSDICQIVRDAACDRQCPSWQIAAVLQQIKLNIIREIAIQNYCNLFVRRCIWTKPSQRLDHGSRWSSSPFHYSWARVSKTDRSSIYLEHPRGTICYIACLCGYRVCDTQLISRLQTIGHNPHTISPGKRSDGDINIRRAGRFSTLLNLGLSYSPRPTRRRCSDLTSRDSA